MAKSLNFIQYEAANLRRACADTWGGVRQRYLGNVPVFAIGCVLYYSIAGLDAVLGQIVQALCFGVGAVAIWIVIKFLYFWTLAPWRFYQELEFKRSTMPGQIESKINFGGEDQLAGLVRRVSELALDYSFKLPVSSEDPFIDVMERLEKSEHACWAITDVSQLRRDFIHACKCLGDCNAHHEGDESKYWRSVVYGKGEALIETLLQNGVSGQLQILFGNKEPYVRLNKQSNGQVRTISVAIRNPTTRVVTNCALFLKDIDNKHSLGVEYAFPPEGFQLLPGTSQFIKIASFHENSGSAVGAKEITICADTSSIAGSFGSGRYDVSIGEHVLTIEAVCSEMRAARAMCSVRVDGEGKLIVSEV